MKINYMEYPYPLNIFVEASDKMGMPLTEDEINNLWANPIFFLTFEYVLEKNCSPMERDIVRMYYNQQLQVNEIVEELDLPRETVAQSKRKILRKLCFGDTRTLLLKGFSDYLADAVEAAFERGWDAGHGAGYAKGYEEGTAKCYKEPEPQREEVEEMQNQKIASAEFYRIGDLNLSTRTTNALLRAGFHTLREVAEMPPERILNLRGLGLNSFNELRDCMMSHGFNFDLPKNL